MKLEPKMEAAWVAQQLDECFDKGVSLENYAKQNGLCNESQGLVGDHCWKPDESLTASSCPVKTCINIICMIGDNNIGSVVLAHPSAIKIYCTCTTNFNWCRENQVPQYAEIYLLRNLDFPRRQNFLLEYTQEHYISDDAVSAYLTHYDKWQRKNHTVYFSQSILGIKRPDEIVRKIHEQNPGFIKSYFETFEDIPEDIFEKMLPNESFFNNCIVSKGLTSPRLLAFLMLKSGHKHILAYLNAILNERFAMQIFLSAEEQKLFLQRKDFGSKTDYIINFYNAVVGFDTEVLEECDRLDLLEGRPSNRQFSLTDAEKKKLEEEEERRKQEEAEEEERQKQQQAEEEEYLRLHPAEETECVEVPTAEENPLQQQLDETQKNRERYVERVAQIKGQRKDNPLWKFWHAISYAFTLKWI